VIRAVGTRWLLTGWCHYVCVTCEFIGSEKTFTEIETCGRYVHELIRVWCKFQWLKAICMCSYRACSGLTFRTSSAQGKCSYTATAFFIFLSTSNEERYRYSGLLPLERLLTLTIITQPTPKVLDALKVMELVTQHCQRDIMDWISNDQTLLICGLYFAGPSRGNIRISSQAINSCCPDL